MPELPEIETIKRGLENRIVGRKIAGIEVKNTKAFLGNQNDAIGRKIESIRRRAKVLCICLEGDKNLLFHLKMTGQLIYRQSPVGSRQSNVSLSATPDPRSTTADFAGGHPSKDWVAELPNSFSRIIFTFDDGSKLFFNDMRMFGWCKVLSNEEVEKVFSQDYGPEPFDFAQGKPSKEFTVEYLKSRAAKVPNRKAKQFITDQKIIAGVGNIYADEALFYAKISPLRPAKELSGQEWRRLREAIIKSLELGIKWGGASIDTFVNAEGEAGGAHLHTKVYRHTGKLCPGRCGGVVRKITLGGRGTHYCPNCQK